MDYGTVAEVAKTDLRFLAKEFAVLPAFGRRGILDNIKPTFGTWTINTMHFFASLMKLYRYDMISGTITNINEEVYFIPSLPVKIVDGIFVAIF